MSRTLFLVILLLLAGCGADFQDDYNDSQFELIDQNGETVTFPDDLNGSTVLMGFVYTHCPDICSFITANLRQVYDELDDPEGIKFVIVTFDPERDTPDVMKSYAAAFDMDRSPFLFLTGETEEIESMMQRLSVRTQVSYSRETEGGDELYFLNHSDKILLINRRSQLVMEYGGSMTPVHILLEDLNKL